MGILIELLGIVVAVALAFAALKRAGVDIGWFNPFSFMHRRRWQQKSQVPPLFALEHPVDVVALLVLATVQTTGAVSSAQKAGVHSIFMQYLNLGEDAAHNLWISSSHLLRHRPLDLSEVPHVLQRSAEKFTDYHLETLRTMLVEANAIEPPTNTAQQALLSATDIFFAKKSAAPKAWA